MHTDIWPVVSNLAPVVSNIATVAFDIATVAFDIGTVAFDIAAVPFVVAAVPSDVAAVAFGVVSFAFEASTFALPCGPSSSRRGTFAAVPRGVGSRVGNIAYRGVRGHCKDAAFRLGYANGLVNRPTVNAVSDASRSCRASGARKDAEEPRLLCVFAP